MSSKYLYICFILIFGCVMVCSLTDYALHFPVEGTADYVNIWGMPSLTQFTVCLWMKSSDTSHYGTPFSYSTPGQDNTIIVYNYRSFEFYINGKFRTTHVSANDGRWHHICASWENKLGSWKLYKDGFVASSGIWFLAGHVIKSGGSLTLAQEQDSVGGRFATDQCFIGMLTNVNVWNYVLSTAQVKQMSKFCHSGGEGNVYKWSDFIHGREGKARVVMPSPCKPQAF